jgi:hypothetical protein
VTELNKIMPPALAEGEFSGLSKISSCLLEPLRQATEQLLEAERFGAYYEEAFEALIGAGSGRFWRLDVGQRPWCEIDFPADLERATLLFGGQGDLGQRAG